jgi:endonuclease-3 related protein
MKSVRPARSGPHGTLKRYYKRLFSAYGPQHWWPADTPFEVMVGAILTQNTAWTNVERAVANLKKENALTPEGLKRLPLSALARLIRPAGYFNVKAKRLKAFIRFLYKGFDGDLDRMFKTPTPILREQLLGVWGVGPETADSMLLYAARRPVFVVDAYTQRVLVRHELAPAETNYAGTQRQLMDGLPQDVKYYNEYHALLVRVGKQHCGTKPRCDGCPLSPELPPRGPITYR